MTADVLDVLTPGEALACIGATNSPELSGAVGMYVTSVSRMIDNLCGPVVVRTLTNERYEYGKDYTADVILLQARPVQAVTTVVEYASDSTATTVTADTGTANQTNGYLWNLAGHSSRGLYRRSGGFSYPFPTSGHVLVTYVAGRYATTATVDARFKVAATIIFSNLWRFAKGTGNQTFGAPDGLPGFAVPYAALAVLSADLLPPGVA